MRPNDISYISFGVSYRLSNSTKINLNLIEIHNENYLGEWDINRFEDKYLRKFGKY